MAGGKALLSLDVFDTLITRVYARPGDVFAEVADVLAGAGLLSIAPAEWVKRRMAVEARLWRNNPEAVSLPAIYNDLEPGWSAQQRLQACEIEIAVETGTHVPVPSLRKRIERWRDAGGEVVFVSDMYLPAQALRLSLRRQGWIFPQDLLFVSSERRATKAGGRLFAQVLHNTGAAPEKLTHIGDNLRADVIVPRRLGLRAEHFSAAALNRYEARIAAAAIVPPRAASLYAGSMRLARLESPFESEASQGIGKQATIWRTGADVIGPVLTAFVLWVLERARALCIKRLYFLARDGQILLGIARALDAERRYGIELRYLHASRQAWHPAAIAEVDQFDWDWVFEAGVAAPSLNQIAARLTLEPSLLVAALADSGARDFNPDAALSAELQERLRACMTTSPLRDAMLAQSRALRDTVLDYLGQEGMFDGVAHAIVDVGWNGRLQRSLSKILAAAGKRPPTGTCGLYFGLRQKARAFADDRMEAFFYDPDISNPQLGSLCNGPMLEQFTEADHGTTLRFERIGTALRPVLKEPRNTLALVWGLETQHAAILAFAQLINRHLLPRMAVIPAEALRSICEQLLAQFLFSPSLEEAEVYGGFEKTGSQDHLDQVELAPRIGVGTAIRMALLGQGRFGRARDPFVLWLPGTLMRSGLPLLNRWVRTRSALRQAIHPSVTRST